MSGSESIFTLCCSLALLLVMAFAQSATLVDSSDWWSITREDPLSPNVRPSNRELARGNFAIAGVTLDEGGFDAITKKLGETVIVTRGDGSTGRSQACYTPATTSAVHLVFEFGEDESLFYLFSGGPDWNGSGHCAKSKGISVESSTESGLRLGMTRAQVEGILGHPDAVLADEIIYSRQFQRKSTTQQFETLRRDYPGIMSDA